MPFEKERQFYRTRIPPGEIEVSGQFVRVQEKGLVIILDPPGIPYATLMALQKFLMKRYPGRASG